MLPVEKVRELLGSGAVPGSSLDKRVWKKARKESREEGEGRVPQRGEGCRWSAGCWEGGSSAGFPARYPQEPLLSPAQCTLPLSWIGACEEAGQVGLESCWPGAVAFGDPLPRAGWSQAPDPPPVSQQHLTTIPPPVYFHH